MCYSLSQNNRSQSLAAAICRRVKITRGGLPARVGLNVSSVLLTDGRWRRLLLMAAFYGFVRPRPHAPPLYSSLPRGVCPIAALCLLGP